MIPKASQPTERKTAWCHLQGLVARTGGRGGGDIQSPLWDEKRG